MNFRYAPARHPVIAADAMIATSQPSATLAGLGVLRRGGNAVDAALAAAAVLCVSEPMSTGVGGDLFAIVSDSNRIYGLDAAGPAPRSARTTPVASSGPMSAVVPGAVRGWEALSARLGRLGLDAVLAPAIDLAREGVAAGFHCARAWREAPRAPAALGPPPKAGERFALPELGVTLAEIAAEGPDAFYRGRVARAIASATWLEEEDLGGYRAARWVQPLSVRYRGLDVFELPPPTQGVAALEGLGLLALGSTPTLADRIRAAGCALEDAFRFVRDGADVGHLLSPTYLAQRVRDTPPLLAEPRGGTVYLCCVDGDGMAVSLIQSLFEAFGSGVVASGTGVVLNNRAACFAVEGAVRPGQRPYHTIIPGLLGERGRTIGPFGVMGGFIQAQAHIQFVSALVDDGLDPQAALDRPRFRVQDGSVRLEEGLWDRADELAEQGFPVVRSVGQAEFGGGQAILIEESHLLGASDARKDGLAAGF